MTKAIRSYPEIQRTAVIEHRANSNTGGLGYLAAQDAKNAEIRKAIVKNVKEK